ncbi:MAG TPA: hypothetical protein VMN77_11885 [Nitrospiria bacterium]|nr:hypothetical protein [Nitrospiria bacterium]
MAIKTSSVRSRVIGIVSGMVISAAVLTLLVLWPLSNETVTVVPPPNPPVPAPPAITTEPPQSAIPLPPPPEPESAGGGIEGPRSKEAGPTKVPKPESRPAAEKDRGASKPTEPEKNPAPDTVVPAAPSRSFSPSDLQEVHTLLNRLKTAYAEKDILSIKKEVALSTEQESFLKKIFNSYKTVQSDVEAVKIVQDQLTSAILITALENERGNVVIPASSWGRQSLRIAVSESQVSKVTLDADDFQSSQRGPLDLIAPVIVHSLPAYTARPGEPSEVTATITDNVKVDVAMLHFRAQGEKNYESIRMTEGSNHAFTAPIPGSMIKAESTSMEYYIEARDSEGNLALEGRPNAPLVIAVVPTPTE